MSEVAQAVAGTLVDMFGMPEQDEPPVASEAGAPIEVPEPQIEKDIELPDDIAELLEGPDDDEDVEPVDLDEYQDPDELAREVAKLRKKNKWLEEQNLAKGRKEWTKEAIANFEYINKKNVVQIEGVSRRSFIRAASALNEMVKEQVEPILAERMKKLTAVQTAEQAAAREAAASAWGKPVTGGAPAPAAATTTADERLLRARANRDLTGSIRALIDSGAI